MVECIPFKESVEMENTEVIKCEFELKNDSFSDFEDIGTADKIELQPAEKHSSQKRALDDVNTQDKVEEQNADEVEEQNAEEVKEHNAAEDKEQNTGLSHLCAICKKNIKNMEGMDGTHYDPL